MRMLSKVAVLSAVALLVTAGSALAETKVTVSNVHLCCGACIKAVDAALNDVDGISHETKKKGATGSVIITAESDAAAQKGIDALQAAGFYGKSDSDKIKFSAVKAPEGKVKRLELTGVHNCCGSCNSAITKALDSVDGVASNTAKVRQSSFVVEGEFSADAVIAALLDKGFAVQVKK